MSQELAVTWKSPSALPCIAISITEPGVPDANLPSRYKSVLRLAFYDVRNEDGKEASFLVGPSPEIAKKIVDFIDEFHLDDKTFNVVVHCHAGVSRSAAIAKFIEDEYEVKATSPAGTDLTCHNKDLYKFLCEAISLAKIKKIKP